MNSPHDPSLEGVAVIGLAGRFPGADGVDALWRNLCEGRESVARFTDEELLANGTDPALLRDPAFVRARAVLEGVELFDDGFFGFTPRDAEITDPQHRLFLECAWQALEDGGYDPAVAKGSIGVFAGSSFNTYLQDRVFHSREKAAAFVRGFQVDGYNILVGNDKDYLATRVAYKLDLRGPAVAIQTACSTSLVAICQAVSALNAYQCDMALAGGVSISFPQIRGYLYQEGAIASADGHCRAFDAEARGTIFGAGVGVVLLKRLAEAVADRDNIYAVIKGAAINNDGADKVSYMAPSVNGQAEVIALAQALAGVPADSVSYIEAHGTGTPLGDPIEVAALTKAFRVTTEGTGFCALGTVKSNFGHLEAAAGVTGLIKVALALRHRVLPPSLNYARPNPKIDFGQTPFYVLSQLKPWENCPLPRRAGVSSFGVGGTNAHVVLEEAPAREPAGDARPAELLVWSARSAQALESATANLAACLRQGSASLADAAYTLQIGRRSYEHRRMAVAGDAAEAAALLEEGNASRVLSQHVRPAEPRVAFMFPGQGAQHVRMGIELYEHEPVFREHVDHCCDLLRPQLGEDLRALLYPAANREDAARQQLLQTANTQPALFVIEYGLARLWMSWGVKPAALVGHSVGEFVAAVLAGVMTIEDGLSLLAARAQLMQDQPPGGMLAVRMAEDSVRPLLNDRLAIAVVNSPQNCVVSGPHPDVAALQATLEARGVGARPLHTSHAFHSPMMEPILEPFVRRVREVSLKPPALPVVSTLTGQWIDATTWTEPGYWSRQLRNTVRFAQAVEALTEKPDLVLLEVGPGQTLTALAQGHPARSREQAVIPSLPPAERPGETAALMTAAGRLWLAGVTPDWARLHEGRGRRRVSLPTYPFERRRHWLETPTAKAGDAACPVADREYHKPEQGSTESVAGIRDRENLPSAAHVEDVILRQLTMMSDQLRALGRGKP
jgi:phthiocerol/phenolphthiocerol synthesis type-I polyketide synthase E